MDLATFFGIIIGLGILVASLLLGGVTPGLLLQPEAILVVFGGTFTALLINFSFADIRRTVTGFHKALWADHSNPEGVVEYIVDAAVYVRAKGALAIQPLLQEVNMPFLRRGFQMIVDNQPVEHMRAQLMTELEVSFRNDLALSKVFEAAGGFAPTMGIIGAVIGLIEVMGSINTPEELGYGVAAAFIATLYGVGLANLFLLPIAGKLKQRARDEWFVRSIMLEGIVAIRQAENPMMIKERLEAYLEPQHTVSMEQYQAIQSSPAYADDTVYEDDHVGVYD